MKKQFLEIGKIVGTHGLKGEVRIDPWCDSAAFLCRLKWLYDANGNEQPVISAKAHKNVAVVLFKDVHSIEEADRLRGKVVYMNRDDVKLPRGTYFVQDLLGLQVEDADSGKVYGIVTDVLKTGANDVYQVSRDGRDYLIPVIPSVVIERDIDGGIVKIRPMKGLFDDED